MWNATELIKCWRMPGVWEYIRTFNTSIMKCAALEKETNTMLVQKSIDLKNSPTKKSEV